MLALKIHRNKELDLGLNDRGSLMPSEGMATKHDARLLLVGAYIASCTPFI